jgi:hypothetical protein
VNQVYPRAPPDQRGDRSTTQDCGACSITSPRLRSHLFIGVGATASCRPRDKDLRSGNRHRTSAERRALVVARRRVESVARRRRHSAIRSAQRSPGSHRMTADAAASRLLHEAATALGLTAVGADAGVKDLRWRTPIVAQRGISAQPATEADRRGTGRRIGGPVSRHGPAPLHRDRRPPLSVARPGGAAPRSGDAGRYTGVIAESSLNPTLSRVEEC